MDFAKVAAEFAKVGATNAFGGLFLHFLRRSRVSKYPSNAKTTATFAKVAVDFGKVAVDFPFADPANGKSTPGNAKSVLPNANSILTNSKKNGAKWLLSDCR